MNEKKSKRPRRKRKDGAAFIPASTLTERYWIAKGYRVSNVERFTPTAGGGFKNDAFGFADFFAFKPVENQKAGDPPPCIWIQATADTEFSRRLKKILCSVRAYELTQIGHRVAVMAWNKDLVTFRFKIVTLAMFEKFRPGLAAPWLPRGSHLREHIKRMTAGEIPIGTRPGPRPRINRKMKTTSVMLFQEMNDGNRC